MESKNSEQPPVVLPIETRPNFEYSFDFNQYTPPFAKEHEVFGFLSGSEHYVLFTKDEPIFSYNFVQCSGALIKNARTGWTFGIHESTWSFATSLALTLQRPDDLLVYTIQGPHGYMRFSDIDWFHRKPLQNEEAVFDSIDRNDPLRYPVSGRKDNSRKHYFNDYSGIKGVSEEEIKKMFRQTKNNQRIGKTIHLGVIDLPVTRAEANRWHMLYRPKENLIRIYESGARKLFTYKGF